MLNELFPFQKIAVDDLRKKIAMALNSYRDYKVPQVVSLQAPTGSGKTIIMAALIWKIDVFKSKDYFLYRTIFFRNYTIYYSDCICYEFKGNGICLKTSFKTFQIDGNATNFEFILAMLVKNKVKEK